MTTFTNELNQTAEQYGKAVVHEFKRSLRIVSGSVTLNNKRILSDINLTIQKRQTIAFVGESGSGKTTLVNVLSGLLSLNEGQYFIDDLDIRSLDLNSFRSRIGYISQDPVIFNDTIYNNVTFWAPKTQENVTRFRSALQRAAALTFVDNLEQKEETILGLTGLNISGGQKQRLSIARELFKNIDILVLDEATSALDSATEREIQLNIENLKGEYTFLIVAHRLSTIKDADQVVFMDSGKITAIGPFNDLIRSSVHFQEMVKMQELVSQPS